TIKNAYWIKTIDSSIVSETVNLIVCDNLIREFLDM
ncbi:gp37, partial [Listeria innocua FSL S4-378]